MVLYAYCVLIVFSLHRESLKLILVDEPLILRWFCYIQSAFEGRLDLVPLPKG
jgi:hypothetical protein